jgi:hypothetical protein
MQKKTAATIFSVVKTIVTVILILAIFFLTFFLIVDLGGLDITDQ